jgi:hypothetical protein
VGYLLDASLPGNRVENRTLRIDSLPDSLRPLSLRPLTALLAQNITALPMAKNATAATLISISAEITPAATKSMVGRPLARSKIVPRGAERARVKIHYVRKFGIHEAC